MNTNKVEKITNGSNFDFAPVYISQGKEIVFARKTSGDIISLFTLKGNKEKLIAKDIKVGEHAGFYGHETLEESLDIYTN